MLLSYRPFFLAYKLLNCMGVRRWLLKYLVVPAIRLSEKTWASLVKAYFADRYEAA